MTERDETEERQDERKPWVKPRVETMPLNETEVGAHTLADGTTSIS